MPSFTLYHCIFWYFVECVPSLFGWFVPLWMYTKVHCWNYTIFLPLSNLHQTLFITMWKCTTIPCGNYTNHFLLICHVWKFTNILCWMCTNIFCHLCTLYHEKLQYCYCVKLHHCSIFPLVESVPTNSEEFPPCVICTNLFKRRIGGVLPVVESVPNTNQEAG